MTYFEFEATRIAIVRFRAALKRKKLYWEGIASGSSKTVLEYPDFSATCYVRIAKAERGLARLEVFWSGLCRIYDARRWPRIFCGYQARWDKWRTKRLARRCGIDYDENGPDIEALLVN